MRIVPMPIAYWLPLSSMKTKREGFKGLYAENQSLRGVKCLIALVSTY